MYVPMYSKQAETIFTQTLYAKNGGLSLSVFSNEGCIGEQRHVCLDIAESRPAQNGLYVKTKNCFDRAYTFKCARHNGIRTRAHTNDVHVLARGNFDAIFVPISFVYFVFCCWYSGEDRKIFLHLFFFIICFLMSIGRLYAAVENV